MFESLGEKFDSLLRKLRGQGKITERNIEEALRDVYRPAATLQLETLARELGLPVHPATAGGDAVAIAREGVAAARGRGLDTVVVDTAGRQTVDDELMRELERMVAAITPHQVLLV